MTTEGKIKLMIVDDHQMFIDGVKSLLRKEKQFEFIAEANTGEDALRLMESTPPDILITDISMPGMSGNELIEKVKAKNPEIKILVLSMHSEAEVISEIMMQEAEGYILKNTGRQELSSALHKLADGGTFYSDEVLLSLMRKVKKEAKRDKEVVHLSERELEVVRLVVQEMSNEEIAEKLFISKRTVETHRKNINQKTNMKTVVGLIKFAIRNEIASA
jgi:DNA-binding NarL/FixJ family response regulator